MILTYKKCPNIKTAISLWQQSIKGNSSWNSNTNIREYIYHTNGVGNSAYKIAGCCGLNQEKAYVLGLLHDYGEFKEQKDRRQFHGTAGYDEMMQLGFDEVAKTCLSHSFFDGCVTPENYPSYPPECIQRAAQILANQPYDDYDRLIQLSDLMVKADKITTIDERLDFVATKYHVPAEKILFKKEKAYELKSYFDNLCKEDVYCILGLKND